MFLKLITLLIKGKKKKLISLIVKKIYFLKIKIFMIFKIKTIRSFYGINFFSNYDDETFKFYISGVYGNFYWQHIKKKKKKFIFIDIGANQGLYSICAAKNKYCKKVYAFEPVKKTYEYLNKNLQLNNVSRKCIPLKKAISNKSKKKNILIYPNHSGASSLSKKNLVNKKYFSKEKISTINEVYLDRLIKNKNKIDIIVKIDVEGYEEIVIKTLFKTKLHKYISEIFYEIDEKLVDTKKIERLLSLKNYKNIYQSNAKKHYDILAVKKFI